MRTGKRYILPIIIVILAIGGFTVTGCKKFDGIDNNNVVRTPYALFLMDKLGQIYSTNDAKAYRFVFPGDGISARSMVVSGDNILFIKSSTAFPLVTTFVSTDKGLNFNPTNYSGATNADWQSMMLDVPSDDRLYLASTKGKGVEFSQDNGLTWENDVFNPAVPTAAVESFARMNKGSNNGKVYALDNNGPRILVKDSKVSQWVEVVQTAALPAGGRYYLSNYNDALVATDYKGSGVYFSKDGGQSWARYNGLPTSQEILSTSGALDQVLLAGTDSSGMYRLVNDTFQASNNGLQPFTTVYSIVGKQEFFKNNLLKQYVYIGTNKGLFRSEDLGKNWTAVRPGDIRRLY